MLNKLFKSFTAMVLAAVLCVIDGWTPGGHLLIIYYLLLLIYVNQIMPEE